MFMHVSKYAALMGMNKNRVTDMYKADSVQKTPKNMRFWRIYCVRACIMVSLSYTSRMEVRQDHKTGNK